MHLTFLHVDTYNAVNNTNTYTYRLDTPVRGVKSVALKSIELPLGWYSIRAPYNTFSYSSLNGNTNVSRNSTLIIPPGNYTVTQLIVVLRQLINASGNANGMTYTITDPTNTSTNFITISANVVNSGFVNISPALNDVAYLLGFTNSVVLNVGNPTATASAVARNDFDNYISLYIENIPTNSLQRQLISFKIPIPLDNGSIFYIAENALFAQTINITDENYVLDCLKFRLIDRFGGTINNQGLDFSFTLAINTTNC